MARIIRKRQEQRKIPTLREYHEKRNKVLIWHEKGGLGDVLMQRMIFEDFKKVMPDGEFVFACLPEYLDAARDHPFISEVRDANTIDTSEFFTYYNTCVTIADRYENKKAPCPAHRSDIWANYCGVLLDKHEMHLNLNEDCVNRYIKEVDQYRKPGKAVIGIAPISKMKNKTLLDWQMDVILDYLKDHTVIALHKTPIPHLEKKGVPGIYGRSLSEWMCSIAAVDYVISVDTAAFHLAGGLKKPLMGIFTFADGKVYGKYFDFVLVQKHRDNGNWDCGPCFKFGDCPKCKTQIKPCLTELTTEEIQEGIQKMFEKWPV